MQFPITGQIFCADAPSHDPISLFPKTATHIVSFAAAFMPAMKLCRFAHKLVIYSIESENFSAELSSDVRRGKG
jgi:hypothetical protein